MNFNGTCFASCIYVARESGTISTPVFPDHISKYHLYLQFLKKFDKKKANYNINLQYIMDGTHMGP